MSDPHSPRPPFDDDSRDSPRTKAGVELYYWFRGHDEVTGNRLDTETSRLIRAIEDEAAGTPASRETLYPCWFCERPVDQDYLIAGYDTFDEARLVCLDCDRTIHALRDKGWLRATPPEPVGGREALLREAAERVLDWHDHHEQWNPTGDFAALYAVTGRRQPNGDEPVGPRYYGLREAAG